MARAGGSAVSMGRLATTDGRTDTPCRCARRWLAGAMLAGAGILLAGCETLFDAPPTAETLRQEAALKKMGELASSGEQKAMAALPEGLREVGTDPRAAAEAKAKAAATTAASAATGAMVSAGDRNGPAKTFNGRELPAMSFERVEADMPHLAIWGLDEAVFLLDGKPMELGGMTRSGRIGLVAPGRHVLRIECPRDPPFSADFYLEKNERAVVRGSCSPASAANSRQ
jgi:hypothetical protein